jgi:hypothetical protein
LFIKNKLKTNIKLLFPFAMERQTVYGNFGKENDKERVSNSAKPKMRVPLQEIDVDKADESAVSVKIQATPNAIKVAPVRTKSSLADEHSDSGVDISQETSAKTDVSSVDSVPRGGSNEMNLIDLMTDPIEEEGGRDVYQRISDDLKKSQFPITNDIIANDF